VRGEEAKLIGVARSIPNTPVNATQLSAETQNQPLSLRERVGVRGEEAKLIGVARSIPNTPVNATQLSAETQTSPLSLRERAGAGGRGKLIGMARSTRTHTCKRNTAVRRNTDQPPP